uniref:HECT domain-containing protein n=1 Tax=Macrostomum lignano TaxID=282301 RepID=A0A1I8ITH2_9PLAT
MPVHLPGRVAAVSAGSYHCACVLTDGRLYAWGETERGKLGIRNAEDQEFSPVPVPGRVQMVSCGLEHTLVLTENGRVYVCGSGESGQLGLGTGCTYAPTVKVVSGLEKLKVACVAAGERHSMCVCSRTGQLYAFGDPQHGKLGFKPATSGGGGGGSRYSSSASGGCLFEPTLVTALRPISVQQVVCGTLLTAVLAVPAKDAGGGSGRSSSLARPGSSSDNEADDKLPALRGRASSLGRRGSFQELNNNNSGIGTSASLADRRVGGGRLAPLSLNGAERPAPSGSLDRSGRFSPLALRGSSSPRYGSDSDALKPSKRDGDLAGSSRRPRNSTAATKFDSLLMGPSDSQDSQSDNEDEKRLKGSGSRQRGKPSGRLGRDQSPPPSSRAAGRSGGRGGSKPLKPIGHSDEDEENSDKDFGRGPSRPRRPQRRQQQDQRRRRQSTKDARPRTVKDEDDETDEENDRRLTSPSRRRRMSSEGKEPAGRRDSREGDSGVAKGIGCGRGGRSGGDGKTRSCQVL